MAMVLNLALIGLAITLDPLPLTAFIAVLPSKRGVTKGAPLVGFRTWIDTHTDQVIISGSLLLAHRQQPLPDPHLRHHRSPWN